MENRGPVGRRRFNVETLRMESREIRGSTKTSSGRSAGRSMASRGKVRQRCRGRALDPFGRLATRQVHLEEPIVRGGVSSFGPRGLPSFRTSDVGRSRRLPSDRKALGVVTSVSAESRWIPLIPQAGWDSAVAALRRSGWNRAKSGAADQAVP